MKSREDILYILNNSLGTKAYHKFSPFADFPLATDGIIALADAADCYWLLEIIGNYQVDIRLDPNFQVWKLVVNHDDKTAVIYGYNDTTLIVTQDIPYMDFPLDELKLFLMRGIILLPSEY